MIKHCMILLIVFISLLIQTTSIEDKFSEKKHYASVYYNDLSKKYTIANVYDEEAAATCIFIKTLISKGWDQLFVKTNSKFPDSIQAFAAGIVEGYITSDRISSHSINMNSSTWGEEGAPENVLDFIYYQDEYLQSLEELDGKDEYMNTVVLIYQQFKGLMDGYNIYSGTKKMLSKIDFHTMNSSGDIGDIKYYKTSGPNFEDMSTVQLKNYVRDNTHCSALIKIKEDYSDLWFGHNTWSKYASMTRIVKSYTFSFNDSVGTRTVSFSSYPGTINSIDDFYVLSNDLVVLETTNPILNKDLFQLLNPKTLLTWHRSMVANRLATDSKSWIDIFVKHNSGTYNNQFIILDLNKVDTERKVVYDQALMIVEQIPGYCEENDVTEFLRLNYWPSYNSPFSAKIRDMSSYSQFFKKHPILRETMDYYTCARAEIFRRDAGNIHSIEDLKKFIRYNKFQTDILSLNDPSYTISSRYDLMTPDSEEAECEGALDAKVGSINDIKGKSNKGFYIVQGPTNQDQEAFEWGKSEMCKNVSRLGLPDKFEYDWWKFYSSMENDFSKANLNFLESK